MLIYDRLQGMYLAAWQVTLGKLVMCVLVWENEFIWCQNRNGGSSRVGHNTFMTRFDLDQRCEKTYKQTGPYLRLWARSSGAWAWVRVRMCVCIIHGLYTPIIPLSQSQRTVPYLSNSQQCL